jgi:hypothetical protein
MLTALAYFSLVIYPFLGIVTQRASKQFLPDNAYKFIGSFVAKPLAVLLPLAAIAMGISTAMGAAHFDLLQIVHTGAAGLAALFHAWLYMADQGEAARIYKLVKKKR